MSFLAGDKSFSPRRTNPWIIMQTFELLVGPLERFFPSLIVECSSLSAGMPYVFHGNFSFAMCLPNKTRDFASRGAQPKRSRPPRFFSSVVRGSSSRRSLINGWRGFFSFFFLSRRHDGSIVIIIFHEPRAFIIDRRWCQPASPRGPFYTSYPSIYDQIRYIDLRLFVVNIHSPRVCSHGLFSIIGTMVNSYRKNGREDRSYYIGQVLQKNSEWYESIYGIRIYSSNSVSLRLGAG